jgi:phosphopantetheine--protein transferase-like protein
MDGSKQLREIVAVFFEISPDAMGEDFNLSTEQRQGSIARYALAAIVRREMGIQSRAIHSAKTYGELESALLNGEASAPQVIAHAPVTGPAGAACGVDIELVENLPPADDYFSHEFYQDHFSPAEIAYCVAQESPAMHFAARWCAKEALKKCSPAHLEVDMNSIEVAHDAERGVILRSLESGEAVELPYAVSLTHTHAMGAAIVVGLHGGGGVSGGDDAPQVVVASQSMGQGTLVSALALIVAVVAAVLALIAILGP